LLLEDGGAYYFIITESRLYAKLLLVWSLLWSLSVSAHPLTPIQVESLFFSANKFELEATFKVRELFLEELPTKAVMLPAGIDPRYLGFVSQYVSSSSIWFDETQVSLVVTSVELKDIPDETGLTAPVRALVIRYTGECPAGAKTFSWSNEMLLGSYVLVLKRGPNDNPEVEWLEAGQRSKSFAFTTANEQTTIGVIARYLGLGFTHILPLGLDHVLFVLGIFFLCRSWRPMVLQVSAFTAAHTLTLALTAYGVVSLPASIVEPLIALSIAYVGIENIFRSELKNSRLLLVFGFGLLHGMGFAGALQELGIPTNYFFASLLSFNVGVELGQLAVLGLAFLLVGAWTYKKEWYRRRVVIPASVLIALLGLYWAVERVYLTLYSE
jgi:hydrogenase/urease accessory protein HupE